MATIVVTVSLVRTGIRFRLASSNGLTLQMAAAGIRAHSSADIQEFGNGYNPVISKGTGGRVVGVTFLFLSAIVKTS